MMITRVILESDIPAIKALWATLHAQTISDNCWPIAPSDEMLAYLVTHNQWAIAKDPSQCILGFSFWNIDKDGNANVRAIAAMTESVYLRLCLPILQSARECGYGMLNRNRNEWTWFENVGAGFETIAYQPVSPMEKSDCFTREEILSSRIPMQDRVGVPVRLIPTMEKRLAVLEGVN